MAFYIQCPLKPTKTAFLKVCNGLSRNQEFGGSMSNIIIQYKRDLYLNLYQKIILYLKITTNEWNDLGAASKVINCSRCHFFGTSDVSMSVGLCRLPHRTDCITWQSSRHLVCLCSQFSILRTLLVLQRWDAVS